MSAEHNHPDCSGRWDHELLAGQVYVRCESCHAVRPGDPVAEVSEMPEPDSSPDARFRKDLAYALGYPPEAEPPEWMDLVQQVRRDRTVRQEMEFDAWGHVAGALRALEKHWPALNLNQQWSAREHLRSFAKTLPKSDQW